MYSCMFSSVCCTKNAEGDGRLSQLSEGDVLLRIFFTIV